MNKETSITKEDYNTVKELMLKHLYEEDMAPNDIVKLYNIKCNDSYMVNFLITSFRIKMRSVKDSVILTYKNLGYYDNKTEKELYCMKCAFNFSSNLYQYVLGKKEYKWYNSTENKEGISRDHRISVNYGWNNKINPNLISHPANCELMLMTDNNIKRTKCSITVDELKEAIKEWDMKYGVYNQTIYDENLLE